MAIAIRGLTGEKQIVIGSSKERLFDSKRNLPPGRHIVLSIQTKPLNIDLKRETWVREEDLKSPIRELAEEIRTEL